MKTLLVLIASLFIYSCASPKKTDETAAKKETTISTTSEKEKKSAKKTAKSSKTATSTKTVVCKIKGDTRKLSLKTTAGGGCKLHYTKARNEKVIANAQNDMSYCKKVLDRVKDTLEEAGFSCN